MNASPTRRAGSWALCAWLGGYVVLLAALLTGLFYARQRTLDALAAPQALAAHRAWKRETERQSQPDYAGPVRRKAVVVDEPPGLILMRDHFPVILLVNALVASVLYGFLAVALRGSFAPQPPPAPGATERRRP